MRLTEHTFIFLKKHIFSHVSLNIYLLFPYVHICLFENNDAINTGPDRENPGPPQPEIPGPPLRARLPHALTARTYRIFVADGINSVGDYNSPPGGCRHRRRRVCPHFFSCFTIG